VRLWRKTAALLSVYYAYMLAYRAELVLWALANSLPFILMGVWMKAGESGTFALSSLELARYFLAVFVVRQATVVWVIWEFEHDVVKGGLSSQLLMPLDPAWRHLAGHVAERGARLPFTALIVALFFVLYPDAFWVPGWRDAASAGLFVVLAFGLRFAMQYSLAMLAFWTERASNAANLWALFYLFLSGLIAPLEVFPEAMRDIAMLTPFPYVVYVPTSLLLGQPVDMARGLVTVAVWGAAFFVLNRVLWRVGLKRYSAMGA
jgi:ABC-2 type transport system permease protein